MGVSCTGPVVTTARGSTGSRVITVVCAPAAPAPASSAATIAAWRKCVISSSSPLSCKPCQRRVERRVPARIRAASRIPSLYVGRFAHQLQFCLQHCNPLLCLGFGQTRAKGLGLIGVESKLSKQICLIGSHQRDGVRTLWLVIIIVRMAVRFLPSIALRIDL